MYINFDQDGRIVDTDHPLNILSGNAVGPLGASGQVLTVTPDGQNLMWSTPAGGGTVTGTSTASRVAYWSTTSAITGAAGFTFDGTNLTMTGGFNVGTATGAGSGVMILAGSAAGTVVIDARTTNALADSAYMLIQSRARFGYENGTVIIDDAGTTKAITFRTGTTPTTRLTISNTGTVTTAADLVVGTTVTSYNGVSTVGNGVPSLVATVDLTVQAASIGTTTLYAVPAAGVGLYRLNWYIKVTKAATSSSTVGPMTFTHVDAAGITVTTTAVGFTQAGAAATSNSVNTTQGTLAGSQLVWAKASTNITYAFTYASSGVTAMTYDIHIKVECLG